MVHERRIRSASHVRRPGAGLIGKAALRSITNLDMPMVLKTSPRNLKPQKTCVSLTDIMVATEKEIEVHSTKCKRDVVANARQILTDRTNLQSFDYRRPHTSVSRYIQRQDSLVSRSGRSVYTASKISLQGESEIGDEFDTHSIRNLASPAPVCCEIMGPELCHECSRLRRQKEILFQNENSFQTIRMSINNILACAILQNHHPQTAREVIQDKIARGEFSQNRFLKLYFGETAEYKKIKQHDALEKSYFEQKVEKDSRLSERCKKQTKMYFFNIKDLNNKITSGKLNKSQGFSKDSTPQFKWKRLVFKAAEPLFPVFVSPKKVDDIQEPNYKVYFEPPLVPKRKQIFEPPFFAGSDSSYSLPDRLPEELRFIKNQNSQQSKCHSEQVITSIIEEDEEC